MRRAAHDENKKNKLAAIVLVTAVVLVTGYAAMTRYDRFSGEPQEQLEALQPKPDQPVVTGEAANSAPKDAAAKVVEALTESVRALVAEEQALPAPSRAGEPVASSTPQQTPPRIEAKASSPATPVKPPDLVDQAAAKVAEADAIVMKGGYQQVAAPSATQSPDQQRRVERISALRGQLEDMRTGTDRAGGSSSLPEQQFITPIVD